MQNWSKCLLALIITCHGLTHVAAMECVNPQPTVRLMCKNGSADYADLEVLRQSLVLDTMLNDVGSTDSPIIEIPFNNISIDTMEFMYQCMCWLHGKEASIEKSTYTSPQKVRETIAKFTNRVVDLIKADKWFCTTQGILQLIYAANFLNIPLLHKALCCVAADNLDVLFPLQIPESSGFFSQLFAEAPSRWPKEVPQDIRRSIGEAHYFWKGYFPEDMKTECFPFQSLAEWRMINDSSIPEGIKHFHDYISHCVANKKYDELHDTLNFLNQKYIQIAQRAFYVMIEWIRTLPKGDIRIVEIFTDPALKEGHFKMALRVMYALLYKQNLDDLECIEFIANKTLINSETNNFTSTNLFGPEHLHNILPLLEPIFKIIIISLNLSYNNLTEIPAEICYLSRLQELKLQVNHLKTIPLALFQLINLKTLWLDSNKFTDLPSEMSTLSHLENLSMTNNRFKTIPEAIFKLNKLKVLHLYGNKITALPTSITSLECFKNLKELALDENVTIPVAVAKRAYLHDLLKISQWNPITKTWVT